MTRFVLLPPDIQALERRRRDLSRRLSFLSPNSRRGRALRREHLALTSRIVALELRVFLAEITPEGATAGDHITPASQPIAEDQHFKRYWWNEF